MDFWGFENEQFTGTGPGFLKIRTRGGGQGGGGADGAKKTDDDAPIAPSNEGFSRTPSAEELAKPGNQEFVVVFSKDDPKKKQEIAKLIREGKPLEKGYGYRLFYRGDGKTGLSTDEAKSMSERMEDGLPLERLTSEEDATPQIFYYDPADGFQETALSAVKNTADVEEEDEDKLDLGSPVEYGESLAKRLEALDDKDEKLQATLEEMLALLLLGGDLEWILQVLRVLESKMKIETAKIAATLTEAKSKIGKQNQALNKKLVKLLRGKGENIKHDKIQEIRFLLEQNQTLLNDVFTGMLRDATNRNQEYADITSSIAQRIERIAQTYSVWR